MTPLPNAAQSAEALIAAFTDGLRSRLPRGWAVSRADAEASPTSTVRPDALIALTTPAGDSVELVVEYKSRIDPVTVPSVLAQLERRPGAVPVVMAPFLSRSVRRLLSENAINWNDAAGNLRLAIDRPAVYIEAEGAATNPEGRVGPLKSLRGPGAATVVRALCDFRPPYTLAQLAERTRLSVATVYRAVELLIAEAIVEKAGKRGPIVRVDWERLLQRWTEDYTVTGSNRVATCLDPRGISVAVAKLAKSSSRYAITGSFVAARFAPAAPVHLLMVYASQPDSLIDELELTQVDAGANVFVIEPFSGVVFERTSSIDGLSMAALSQVAADLMTSPGRGPSEAEVLIRWMRDNEDAWRA